ncbi:MAG: hypothetical protein MJ099_03835 [Clostridia bacterium]|nr:hypothetical protein [Clostridia bacterium]
MKFLIVLVILIAVILIGGRLYFRLPYSDYYKASEKALRIPEITKGYVPQGLEYLNETDRLLLTGYTKDGSPSPMYVVDRKSGALEKKVFFRHADGTECRDHNGGLAVHGDCLYVCDDTDNVLRVYSLADLNAAADGDFLNEIAAVPLTAGDDVIMPAFVEATEDGLIVGEFYYAGKYETPVSHYVGDHHGLAIVLPYADTPSGVDPTPVRAYSLPDKAQGICFDTEGILYVSESWGTAASVIETYRDAAPEAEIEVLGVTLPMTVLNDDLRLNAAKIAPMSEEIAVIEGMLYVNCESASNKYFFGRLNAAQNLFATPIEFFK